MSAGTPASASPPLRSLAQSRTIAIRVVLVVCVIAVTAVISDAAEWRPLSLVLVLGAGFVVADVATIETRRVRLSAGLSVQATIMALLGPGPAVAGALVASTVESRIHRVPMRVMWTNLALFTLLGLVGGVMFDELRAATGLEREDVAYAVAVIPMYAILATLNIIVIAAIHANLAPGSRSRIFRETGLPFIPVEMASGVLAAVAVLAWAQVGLGAVAALVLLLAITIPLRRTFAEALHTGDDLVVLRQESDERAAEVARLASDRERLLSEMLKTEERERARLAESLHDGPMQRFIAIRQDAADTEPATAAELTERLDKAIAETRSLISAFHPATVRELGFERSLRAAIEPFPAAADVQLSVQTGVDDRTLADSLALPVAQELVVNAVKHADPTAIDVLVHAEGHTLVLEVNDNGVGIDAAVAGRAIRAGHLGLAMVRQRVETAGGQFDLDTRLDGGTRSRVTLPWL